MAAERLARAVVADGALAEARTVIDEVVARLAPGDRTPAALLALTTWAGLATTLGDHQDVLDRMPRVTELARALGDTHAEAELLNYHGTSLAALHRLEEGLERLDEAAALALEVGDVDRFCHAVVNRHIALQGTGDLEAMLAAGRRALDVLSTRPASCASATWARRAAGTPTG